MRIFLFLPLQFFINSMVILQIFFLEFQLFFHGLTLNWYLVETIIQSVLLKHPQTMTLISPLLQIGWFECVDPFVLEKKYICETLLVDFITFFDSLFNTFWKIVQFILRSVTILGCLKRIVPDKLTLWSNLINRPLWRSIDNFLKF